MKTFNLIKPKAELVDVIEALQEFPNFSRVTDAQRADVKVGSHAKIGCEGEYFWVEVLGVRDGKLYGRVNNDLEFTDRHGLAYDDAVEFERRHIREVQGTL